MPSDDKAPNAPEPKGEPSDATIAVATAAAVGAPAVEAIPVTADATAAPQTDAGQSTEPSKGAQTIKFKVKMGCNGCRTAIDDMLKETKEGVEDYKVSFENKTVEVTGTIEPDVLKQKIEDLGKKVESGPEIVPAQPPADVANKFLP